MNPSCTCFYHLIHLQVISLIYSSFVCLCLRSLCPSFLLVFIHTHAEFKRGQKTWEIPTSSLENPQQDGYEVKWECQGETCFIYTSKHLFKWIWNLTGCFSPLLALHHTIVSEPDPFPVKKSQKLAVGDGLLSSCGVCLTQMLFSVEPLRLELREKLSAELRPGPRRSWASESWVWSLGVEDEDKDEEEKEDWDRLSRLWWEWNWRMWRMDLPGGTSPAGPRTGQGFVTWKKKTIYYLKVV